MNNNSNKTSPSSKAILRPALSGTTLEQVLQFVLPEDVARASMVCKAWRDDLKPPPTKSEGEQHERAPPPGVVNSKAIWKQAVTNSSPNVIQAVIEASGEKEAAHIDFHALAKSGLGRKRKKPELPEPTFRIEDLLIVLEIKQKKIIKDESGEKMVSVESLGTFFSKGSEDMLRIGKDDSCGNVDFDLKKGPDIVLEGLNPLCLDTSNGDMHLWQDAKTEFHTSLMKEVGLGDDGEWYNVLLPMECSGKKALDKLMASVTLFRRDDWRSFCLFDDVTMDVDYDFCYDFWWSEETERFSLTECPHWGQTQSPFARNELGSVAHETLESNEISTIRADVHMTFDCVLPPRGAPNEPSWLQQFRLQRPTDTEWTEQETTEIAQVKTFQFRLDSIFMNMGKGHCGDDWNDIKDPKGFLLLLEGLDWQ